MLVEVREDEATGAAAEIFGEIRRATGLPFVNLFYRHLAALGRLESVWPLLQPNLLSSVTDDLADSLIFSPPREVPRIPGEVLTGIGVDDRWTALAKSTFAAYEYANTRNILLIQALLFGCPGAAVEPGIGDRKPQDFRELLPMADLSRLPAPVRDMLEYMSRPLMAGSTRSLLVPSLLRHFGEQPAVLGLMWVAILPMFGPPFGEAVRDTAERARALAIKLPHPVHRSSDTTTRAALTHFSGAVSTMIVAGALLKATLFGRDEGRPRPA